MGKIDYRTIYETNKDEWKALTREPQKYEALLAGHYSESNHFVYELLQNAEDEQADRVVIEYYDDKLVFYHNGAPFDQNDVRGVSSMLMGTKDKNDAQTIGRFGMGFKSVFKYTCQPEIYSDSEAFRLENYLLPVELESGWDFEKEKEELRYKRTGGGSYRPFAGQAHLTKIIIPFYKKHHDGSLIKVSGKEVLQKLESLTGEILLFLNHITTLYWVNKNNDKFALISLDQDMTDPHLVTCRIEGTAFGGRELITRYLKYKRIFHHPEMKSAEVSVAYKVNRQANNINELSGSVPIWVYFPTRDMTKLPFYIHGAFETAVSREKLMTPSAFNADLFQELGDLICESLTDLKEKNLITQPFIRRVILGAFKDEAENHTIPGLRDKITKAFQTEAIIPDRNGFYRKREELSLPIPFGIGEFCNHALLAETFVNTGHFVAFNNEKELNFNEYYAWLLDDLKIKPYTLADWAKDLGSYGLSDSSDVKNKTRLLEPFYDFLSDYRESLYISNRNYSRSGRYEQSIRDIVEDAWVHLRYAPIIINALGDYVSAYKNDSQNLYLSESNDYKTLVLNMVIYKPLVDSFGKLFREGFQLSNFDNFQFVKEKVIKKYIEEDGVIFETDNPVEEYTEDIKQILDLFDHTTNPSAITDLLKDAFIIKVTINGEDAAFVKPANSCVHTSVEGIDLFTYYAASNDMEEANVYPIDEVFYENQGISVKALHSFGIIVSPVHEGQRSDPGGRGQESWKALGEFCPKIDIDYIDANLRFITTHPYHPLAKQKSAEIFHLVFSINEKLSGTIKRRKVDSYDAKEDSELLKRLKKFYKWLYDKDGQVHRILDISKTDLDPQIYGPVNKDKDAYLRLGFAETNADSTIETFEQVEKLDRKSKKVLLRQLARELGMTVEDSKVEPDDDPGPQDEPAMSLDFPKAQVRNMDSLIEHVKQQFFCADPVKYEKVWRQIRTSRSSKSNRTYLSNMYSLHNDKKICQWCKKPTEHIKATEIANFGMELPQLHLCLCNDCTEYYKAIRDNNKEIFKEAIANALLSLNLHEHSDAYEVHINDKTSITFTEIHVAEIQTILNLLSEHGTPREEKEVDRTSLSLMEQAEKKPVTSVTSEERIEEGALVTYKNMDSFKRTDAIINTNKYPFHKSFIGKKIGDLIVVNGNKYMIEDIL